MKLRKKSLCTIACLALGVLASCSTNASTEFDATKTITRYSRDATSGTRDGFFTAIGYSEAKEDDTKIPGFVKADDNGNMISLVKNDEYGIGYISLASLADSGLTGVKFEGVVLSEEAVVDGTYKLSRNFNYITKVESDVSEIEWKLIKGFKLFMSSQEGLAIVKSKDGILETSIGSATKWSDILEKTENADVKEICSKNDGTSVEIKFGGSTSVEKVAKAITSAFAEKCPTFKPVHNHTGSGAAYKGTQGSEKDSVNSMHVGFLSRELNDSEQAAEGSSGRICKDGIVCVVNAKNTYKDNFTKEELKKIYSTEGIKWNEI